MDEAGPDLTRCQAAEHHGLSRSVTVVVWIVWSLLTGALIYYVRHYTRNIPYQDDWSMVSVVTGHESISMKWAWSQHNEHRVLLPRLILAGLFRGVAPDFRTGLYFNAGLLSLAAAMMLVLARRIRGHASLADVVLPLSILTLAQAEILFIGFALNLVLTAWISYALIVVFARGSDQSPSTLVVPVGTVLILLPLCGGSGLVMVPALILWLAGYLGWGWWSGQKPVGWVRAFGLFSIIACFALISLYLKGYIRPAHHPAAPSLCAVIGTTTEVLSLALRPGANGFRFVSAMIVTGLVGLAFDRFLHIARLSPLERPRALGLAAVILSLMGTAFSVGVSRSGFGATAGLQSRYVCLAAPLLSALYVTALIYYKKRWQWAIHTVLLLATLSSVYDSYRLARNRGESCLYCFKRVEKALQAGKHGTQILDLITPALYPDRTAAAEMVRMLESSRFGDFKSTDDARVTAAPQPAAVRRY